MTKDGHSVRTSNSWRFAGNELKYVQEVLESGFGSSTSGNMNTRLERAFAERFGVPYAVTSNSGTSTLHQALTALGVGPGDEVIIPALTVVMCGYAVLMTGARPVFADVDCDTFLMDPDDVERKITPRTRALMPVHLYGQVCDMDALMSIARRRNLVVVEDCAQCYLGADVHGRIGGTIGHVGSFSFENSKHISTGDGGILVTRDEHIAERMRKFGGMGFRNIRATSGQVRKDKSVFQDPAYLRHDSFGFNYRLSEVAAAVGLAQVERIDELVGKRRLIYSRYLDAILQAECSWLKPQHTPTGAINSCYTFAARYEGVEHAGVPWRVFRQRFVDNGGDGIYAAWALVYNEPVMRLIDAEGRIFPGGSIQFPQFRGFLDGVHCPTAEELQPKLMQFTANQGIEEDMAIQMEALTRTIRSFGTA